MPSPTDIPRRLATSIGNTIEAATELPVFQQQVLEHLASMESAMTEHLASMDRHTKALVDLIGPMGEDISALKARAREIDQRIEVLERAVDPGVASQLTRANATMDRVERSLESISDRVPDPDAPGTIGKVKDAIVGDGA